MTTQVLKVDISGRPVGFIDWFEAVTLCYKGKASVLVAEDEEYWCSPSIRVNKPVIIQVASYVKLKPMRNNYIIKSVLLGRDNWKCGYCGGSLTLKTATKDHIKPVSAFKREGLPKSAASTWENLISACSPCNHSKGSKTCAEWGKYPLWTPKRPVYVRTLFNGGKVHHPIQKQYVESFYHLTNDPNAPAIKIE